MKLGENDVLLEPQKGYQTDFISNPADIVIGGGAAGAGKTFSLLLDAMYCAQTENFGAVIFRRTYPEIMQTGGLWDESKKIYPGFRAKPNESKVSWIFPTGARIAFSHLQHEKDLAKFQGAQIPYIGFDEVTHFSKQMFFYLLTRNRGVNSIRPRVRATCNPDPDSWVSEFIKWWIDEETGFPIPERAGKIRWFVMDNDAFIWGDNKREVYKKAFHLFENPALKNVDPSSLIKSATFIPGNIYENEQLLKSNPQYLANLMNQDAETKTRLLEGNWRIRADESNLFDIYKIKDLFNSEERPKPSELKYITIDHARFGRDLCVVMTWQGWHVIRIDILPKSDTNDILNVIRYLRREIKGIPVSQIIIDQDGIGVKDSIGCRLFQSGTRPHEVAREKPFVADKRTQVYFEAAEKVNKNESSINTNEIYVHENGSVQKTSRVLIRGQWYEVKKMITDDLRTIKREQFELDKPVRITAKETQKSLLGRSPDFGDAFAMRGEFEFIRLPKAIKRG